MVLVPVLSWLSSTNSVSTARVQIFKSLDAFGFWPVKEINRAQYEKVMPFSYAGITEVLSGEQQADMCCTFWSQAHNKNTGCNCPFILVAIIIIYESFWCLKLGSIILLEVCKPCKISRPVFLPVPMDRHLPICADFEEVLASMSLIISKIFWWINYVQLLSCHSYLCRNLILLIQMQNG